MSRMQMVAGIPRRRTSAGGVIGPSAAYLVLSGASSIALLGYPIVAAWTLDVAVFGLFSAIFGLVLVLGVAFTAVQTRIAGEVAASAEGTMGLGLLSRRLVWWVVGVIAVLVGGAPLVSWLLRASTIDILLIALIAALTLVWAGLLGVVQGREQLVALGALNLFQALLRVAAVVVVAPLGSLDAILLATAASMVPALVVAAAVVRREQPAPALRVQHAFAGGALTLLTVAVVGVPSVVDVIIVRATHSEFESGVFAIVATVGRVILFAAIAINTIVYPRLVRARDEDRPGIALRAAGAIAAFGIVVVAVGTLAPDTILIVVAGDSHAAGPILIPYLWAALAFATATPVAYFMLAQRGVGYAFAVLLPTAAVIALIAGLVSELSSLVLALLGASLVFLVANAIVLLRRRSVR